MTATVLYSTLDSPLGELFLIGDSTVLRGLYMRAGRRPIDPRPGWKRSDPEFGLVRAQLDEYFAGERTEFDIPLDLRGSPFQLRVWAALQEIPYGETASYGQIADRIGAPGQARAVGTANGSNPISVIVPCHRVIGADGSLTGYGGGIENKRLLLDLERGTQSLL